MIATQKKNFEEREQVVKESLDKLAQQSSGDQDGRGGDGGVENEDVRTV